MAITKRLKEGEGESQRWEDETWEELVPRFAVMTTQGEEGELNKKTRVPDKKNIFECEKIVRQLREELNLEPIL